MLSQNGIVPNALRTNNTPLSQHESLDKSLTADLIWILMKLFETRGARKWKCIVLAAAVVVVVVGGSGCKWNENENENDQPGVQNYSFEM